MAHLSRPVRRAVVSLLVLGSVLLLGVISTDTSPVVQWPWLQAHSHDFYVTKGLVSVVAVVLIVVHMMKAFEESMLLGQRLRYLALLFLAALVAAASSEQIRQDVPVNGRNVGGLVGAVFVIAAMVVSIHEARSYRLRTRATRVP